MATTTANPTSVSFPPHHHPRPASPIPASTALAHIQAYLTASATTPYLHPDCIFVERQGPAFAGNASVGGVTLHQLRRVEAGLRGIWMGVEVGGDVEGEVESGAIEEEEEGEAPEGDDARLDAQIKDHRQRQGRRWSTSKRPEEEGQEWWGNYQEQLRDQGEGTVQGEIGDRSNAVGNRTEVPTVASTAGGKRRRGEGGRRAGESEKEARKRAKKERAKGEKVQRAGERFERRERSVEVTENGLESLDNGGYADEPDGEETMLVARDKEKGVKSEQKKHSSERKERKRLHGGEDESRMEFDSEAHVKSMQRATKVDNRKGGDTDSPVNERERERTKRKADRHRKKQEKRRNGVD